MCVSVLHLCPSPHVLRVGSLFPPSCVLGNQTQGLCVGKRLLYIPSHLADKELQ